MPWLRAIMLAVFAVLAACATPEKSMNPELRAALGRVDGILLVPQAGLDVSVKPTDGGQGGFLGVLVAAAIDSQREEGARKRAGPILEALRVFDFRSELAKAMAEQSGAQEGHHRAYPVADGNARQRQPPQRPARASGESAVIFVRVGYRLESGDLHVTLRAHMAPTAAALMPFRPSPKEGQPLGEGHAVYRKTFTFVRQNITPENAAAALVEGARSVTGQLLAHLGRNF